LDSTATPSAGSQWRGAGEFHVRVLDYAAPLLRRTNRAISWASQPGDIVGAVAARRRYVRLCDTPRAGRFGRAYTSEGEITSRMRARGSWHDPLDNMCGVPVFRAFSRAYLNHLFKADEIAGAAIADNA